MAAFLFVHRMSELGANLHVLDEIKGAALDDRTRSLLREKRIAVFDVEGPLFFGAAKSFVTNLEKNFDIDTVILDMESVPVVDTTGAVALEQIVSRLHRDGRRLLVVGMRENVRRILYNLGVTQKIGIGSFLPTMDDAIAYAVAIATDERTPRALGEYLHDACILLDVEAASRDELFDTCARVAEKAGAVRDRAVFIQSLKEREALTPTVIGRGVAVPHARTGGVDGEVVLLFARMARPLRYTDDPPADVDFVFMVSASGVERDYLTVLRLIAMNMRDPGIVARLRAATTAADVHYTLSEMRT
jgi:mannitol/fructose-specific phosphotransferase system IIA component (Ntr-type)/anti-anti-sigma regulatory factor